MTDGEREQTKRTVKRALNGLRIAHGIVMTLFGLAVTGILIVVGVRLGDIFGPLFENIR